MPPRTFRRKDVSFCGRKDDDTTAKGGWRSAFPHSFHRTVRLASLVMSNGSRPSHLGRLWTLQLLKVFARRSHS